MTNEAEFWSFGTTKLPFPGMWEHVGFARAGPDAWSALRGRRYRLSADRADRDDIGGWHLELSAQFQVLRG
jgi:hypothetical protein